LFAAESYRRNKEEKDLLEAIYDKITLSPRKLLRRYRKKNE